MNSKLCVLMLATSLTSGCTTSRGELLNGSDNAGIRLSTALQIQPGKTSKKDVERIFGEPTAIDVKAGRKSWTYNLPDTGTQRLTVTFEPAEYIVESVLWIPRDADEGKLSKIKSTIQLTTFETLEPKQDQHFISSEMTLVDQERRVSILSKKSSEHADAVAWKVPPRRLPSAQK